jgi:hypothetical protein
MKRKLSSREVLEIYYSTKSIEKLAIKYKICKTQIRQIKNRVSYRDILDPIRTEAGENKNNKQNKFTPELVRKIYVDIIDRKYCKKKYGVSWRSVKRIKSRITWKKYTGDLGLPGELVIWGLTEQQRREIFWYPEDTKSTAKKYKVTMQTVRNIRKQHYPMPRDMSKVSSKISPK